MKVLLISLIGFIFCSFLLVNGLSLNLRNQNAIGGANEWSLVGSSADGDANPVVYNIVANKVDFIQFRVDVDEQYLLNDLYINVTSTKPSRAYTYFNFKAPANSTNDTRNRVGYTPLWFGACGSESSYFSLRFNNSYTSNLTVTVTSKDQITLCNF
ncbi:hypothetical protein DICPUDRAFT_155157 [Dictyostelium purpureum]|uniref:Uncharacterized protein n=1 Tax=Dictyostelium purpureum TaxID=5786 RepID=F0ZT80_DICPU|nr:uncharacterized protein DICPUDRAFT_155157 [Dictyostelium purpureum]EGC32846.1 hypothetical protein DICPUDRAFT_155157 [Dictyostelium purpureum]|eukprot:XP_003290631.1 hypothetical protein DICPUDRAFT_155157 [Dictyostelium purpureum]